MQMIIKSESVSTAVLLKRGSAALALAAALTFPSHIHFAQAQSGGIRSGAVRVAASTSRSSNLTQKETARLMSGAEQNVHRLIGSSRDAFDRGLMSLSDYADHLDAALSINTALSTLQNSEQARSRSLMRQAAVLRGAVGEIERLGQPGAKGWVSDLAQAKLLVANADIALAQARGDAHAAARHSQRANGLAWDNFNKRLADFKVGLATLPQMSRAASHLSTDGRAFSASSTNSRQQVAKLHEYHEHLGQIAKDTNRLSKRGAGVGRKDRVHMAKLELAKTDALIAGADGRQDAALGALHAADRSADQLYQAQLKFHRTGTASLFDLTRTWAERESLHQEIEHNGQAPKTAGQHQLVNLAGNTRDTRGRNAADVALVHSMGLLVQLKQALQ